MLKHDSCPCVVVHEDLETTTIRVLLKIMNGGDGRAVATTAVIQSTVCGTSLSLETVLSINNVSNVNTAFTAATCKTNAVPLLVSNTSLISFIFSKPVFLSGRCKPKHLNI